MDNSDNKKKRSNKSKEKIIVGSVMGISIVVIAGLALSVKGDNPDNKQTLASLENCYEISGSDVVKFKGTSVISKEQKIYVDKTLGEIDSVKVTNKQHISKGDILFTYHNETIADRISELDIQINSSTKKRDRSNTAKAQYQDEVNSLNNQLSKVEEEINFLSGSGDAENAESIAQEIQKLQAQQSQLSAEIQGYKSQIIAEESTVEAMQDTIDTSIQTKEQLQDKEYVDVKAEIDGIVYLNESAKDNPSIEYIRIISEEPLIKGSVTAYDLDELSVGDKVSIRVNSSGEYLNGEVSEVEDLPAESQGAAVGSNETQSATYNFYVKPEKKITIGFGVEIKECGNEILIPKNYVYEKDSKFYVGKIIEESGETKKVEIKAKLNDDKTKYIYLDGSITDGDKLIENPESVLEDGK